MNIRTTHKTGGDYEILRKVFTTFLNLQAKFPNTKTTNYNNQGNSLVMRSMPANFHYILMVCSLILCKVKARVEGWGTLHLI